MIRLLHKCTVITPKARALLAVPEMFTCWTLNFHMTGAVYERVNEAVSHFNPVNVTMECVLKGWGGGFF